MHGDIQEKILARIDKTESCWIWKGYVHKKDGYGRFRLPRMKWDKTAHRIVFELINNTKIPDNMTIDHICLNKVCVNPAHLEVVTRAENSRRARLTESDTTKTKRIKAGFRGYYNSNLCKRGHRLQIVEWSNGQRRVCRKCHQSNNLYSNKKLPIDERVY